ncbi:MAG: Sir2 family NAD-dependent protein deacetylase [Alphaproteobacteria bacterium]
MNLVEMVAAATNVVIFTGAGMSTESGIPDFRSPGGVWTRMKPILFDDFLKSEEARRETWRRRFEGDDPLTAAKPNQGHYAVAALIGSGKAKMVITQNIDNLHLASGVPTEQIIELHGNASYAKCLGCGARVELDVIRAQYRQMGTAAGCEGCRGLVKPATISFGQSMPAAEMERAREATLACDLFLSIGSSLTVYPANGFPLLASENGADLVIINRDPTELDEYADLVIRGEIGPELDALVRDLGLKGLATRH